METEEDKVKGCAPAEAGGAEGMPVPPRPSEGAPREEAADRPKGAKGAAVSPRPIEGAPQVEAAGAKRGDKRRWPIVVGVVAAVLVCAGAGFYAWHNQPSFCNAICHEPMDYYVEGYYGDAQTGHASLAAAHQREGVTCLQCHEATLEAQVNEGTAWISGSYEVNADGSLTPQLITADKKQCATAACHDWDDVVAATENWGGESGVNPHLSHQGEAIDCSNCHSVHGDSNMYCNACHDYEVPAGWESPARG